MSRIIFILLLGILAIVDYRKYKVPNILVLPAIVGGSLITGHYAWPMIMFGLTALFYSRGFWGGGDVKVFTMIGAFLGVEAIAILAFTVMALYTYRQVKAYHSVLAVTPFVFFSSLPFVI